MRYFLITILLIFQGDAKTIADYFKLFPFKGDFSLEESDKNDVTVDIPNAYIKIVKHGEEDYPFDSEIQFVYFLTTAKVKIFGVTYIERGPNTDLFNHGFYQYEKAQWKEVTQEVLPEELSLELFTGNVPDVEGVGNQYQLEMTLPQKGTNITVQPRQVADTDNPFAEEDKGLEKYYRLFSNLAKYEIVLKWNKEKGVFEIMK